MPVGVTSSCGAPPTGTKARGAHDMRREHDIQAALAPVFPAVPRMVAFCGDDDVIGSQFYVMERIEGTILRRDVPPELGLDRDGVAAPVPHRDRHPRRAARRRRRGGRARRPRPGRRLRPAPGRGLVRPATAAPAPTTSATSRRRWPGSTAHEPADRPHVLIHNDFRFDNLVLDPARPDPHRRRARLGDGHRRRPADGSRCGPGLLGAGRRPPGVPRGAPPADAHAGDADPRRGRRALLRGPRPRGDARAVALLRRVRRLPAGGHRPADLLPLPRRPDEQPGLR